MDLVKLLAISSGSVLAPSQQTGEAAKFLRARNAVPEAWARLNCFSAATPAKYPLVKTAWTTGETSVIFPRLSRTGAARQRLTFTSPSARDHSNVWRLAAGTPACAR